MRFRSKLFLGMSTVLILVTSLTINLFYNRARNVTRDNLRSRLIGIVSTASLMVDAEKLDRVRMPADEKLPEYAEIKAMLRRIKQANPDIHSIFAMRRSPDPNSYLLIVDGADEAESNNNVESEPRERFGRVGEVYQVASPELQKAIHGPVTDRELSSDAKGSWLSGYAPIRDSNDKAVALLGIDIDAMEVNREEWKLELMAVLAFLGGVCLSLLMANFLAKHFTKPIRQLGDALSQVAAGNFETTKLELHRSDEIGHLQEIFNDMTVKLAKARADFEEQQCILETRVADRTEELRQTREAAIESEKMAAVGTLAGGIAHEFNNILCAVRGQVELAALNPTPDRIRRAAESAAACADRTLRITDALMSFARRSALSVRPTDIRYLVETSLGLFKSDFSTLNITVVRKFSDIELLGAEPERLLQAFANVIANARDAMREKGGRLSVIIRPIDQGIEIAFRDTGPGIPERVIGHVFEPFYTTKAPMGSGSIPGMGLGLAAAHGIVKNHGGEILAENNEGGGTTIRIRLPVNPWSGKAKPKPRRFPAVSIRRILIVEDEPDILYALRDLLTLRAWDVETASSGDDALEKAARTVFPVYLIDIAIPGMNGIDLIKRLRSLTPDSVIAVLSGFAPEEIASQLSEQDVAAYISKPFRSEDLIKTIEELVEGPPASDTDMQAAKGDVPGGGP